MTWPNTTTLGGIVLDQAAGSSTRVVMSKDGWDDAPATRSNLAPRAQQDGDWDATGNRSSRVVTIVGAVMEGSSSDAHAVQQQLAALAPQSPVTLTVDNAAVGTLSVQARVTVGAKFTWYGDVSFDYTITVTAPDPLKYGPPVFPTPAGLATATPGAGLPYPLAYPLNYGIAPGVTPGAVSLPNAGTAAYWPRLRVDGPVLNPTITLVETGAWVRYNAALLAGQWLDWDMANRRVLLQGQVSVRQKVSSSGNWLAVPVDGGSITWTADTADPAALLSVWGYERAVS